MAVALRSSFALAFLLLAAVAFAVYWPCLNGPFLWDDRGWSTSIEWLLSDPKALWYIWTDVRAVEQYYPLTTTTVWLDYHLWGWNTLPRHVENVLLHVLSAACLWRLLTRLEVRGAWLAALLLVVHPVMVESVAWITERKNVLCLALSLLSLLAWGRAVHWWKADKPAMKARQALATVLFIAALLAKITAFAVPPAIVILGWWKRGSLRRRELTALMPMSLATLGLGLLVHWLEKFQAGATGAFFDQLSLGQRSFIAAEALWFYAAKLLWPASPCVIYERWPVTGAWWEWLAVIALIPVAVLLWRSCSRSVQSTALLLFIPLLPVLSFLNVNGMRYAWVADRWVYFSTPAFVAVLGWALARWLPRRAFMIVGALMVLGCSVVTLRHAARFGDVDRFWQAVLDVYPRSIMAHGSYADMLMRAKRMEEAGRHFEIALKLEPDSFITNCNLGAFYAENGRLEDALKLYQRAAELQPEEVTVYYNISQAMTGLGRRAEAEEALRKALKIAPQTLPVRNDLASLLITKGEFAEAEEHLRQSLLIRPGDDNALGAMGNLRYRQGRKAEALECFEAALKRKPDLVPVLSNAARILATSGNAALRNGPRARELAERAARLSERQNIGVLNTLSAAYAENGQFAEAVATSKEAIALAESSGQTGSLEMLRMSLQLFESSQPFRTKD